VPPPREPHRYWQSGWEEPRVFEFRHARCVMFRRGRFPTDLKLRHRPVARVVLEHSRVVHRTKAEAVAAGKELARSKTPSHLLVYKADGFEVQEEKTYE
jgi:Uncharacterized protein conserved in bacteria (DUF2188)